MGTIGIARRYEAMYGPRAVKMFVRDLMAGDAATFKVGYTRDNAILAAADAFGIDRDEAERRADV